MLAQEGFFVGFGAPRDGAHGGYDDFVGGVRGDFDGAETDIDDEAAARWDGEALVDAVLGFSGEDKCGGEEEGGEFGVHGRGGGGRRRAERLELRV